MRSDHVEVSMQPQVSQQSESRLVELFGLPEASIQEVIMEGYRARISCSGHHPRTYPGLAQWAETVRALRDKTAPLGWSTSDENNFPLCLHPDLNLTIVVQTGDKETGTLGTPSNRAPKGANTEDAVAVNQRQLSFFDDVPDFALLEKVAESTIMWVLLYHVAANEVRFELSLPSKMIRGKIRSWKERIVFPAIRTDAADLGENDGSEIDVPVERLSGS